jgi:hypothetical protein
VNWTREFRKGCRCIADRLFSEKPAKSLYQSEDSHDCGFTGFAGLVNFLTISYLQFGDIFYAQLMGLTG